MSNHYSAANLRSPGDDARLDFTDLYDVLIAGTPVGDDAAAQPVQAGPVRLFMRVRSDPFFADADGVLPRLQVDRAGRIREPEHPFDRT